MVEEKKRLGDILLENGIIDEFQLRGGLAHQKKWGNRLGEALIELGFISENTLMKVLSKFFNIPSVNLSKIEVSPQVVGLVPVDIVEKHCAVPVAVKDINKKKRLVVAMSDPTNLEAIDEIQFISGYQVLPMVSTVSGIQRTIAVFYRKQDVRGGFSVNDRSGISILAPNPGDSRIEIIRGGEEEVVKLNENAAEPKDGIAISLDQDGGQETPRVENAQFIPQPNETGETSDARELKGFGEDEEDTQLFSVDDLDALDELLPETSAPKSPGSAAKPSSSVQNLVSKLAEKKLLSPAERNQLFVEGSGTGIVRLIKLLEQKGVLSDEEAELLANLAAKES